MSENKLTDLIDTSLEKIKQFAESETVVGSPITVGEITIVPVSKISMGFASGGIDYNGKKEPVSKATNFGGGGGTGVNVSPVAFLVIHSDGRVEVLPIVNYSNDSVEKITSLIERSPEILGRLKDVFKGKKKKEETPEEAQEDK